MREIDTIERAHCRKGRELPHERRGITTITTNECQLSSSFLILVAAGLDFFAVEARNKGGNIV
jgi:hypothetical protein